MTKPTTIDAALVQALVERIDETLRKHQSVRAADIGVQLAAVQAAIAGQPAEPGVPDPVDELSDLLASAGAKVTIRHPRGNPIASPKAGARGFGGAPATTVPVSTAAQPRLAAKVGPGPVLVCSECIDGTDPDCPRCDGRYAPKEPQVPASTLAALARELEREAAGLYRTLGKDCECSAQYICADCAEKDVRILEKRHVARRIREATGVTRPRRCDVCDGTPRHTLEAPHCVFADEDSAVLPGETKPADPAAKAFRWLVDRGVL